MNLKIKDYTEENLIKIASKFRTKERELEYNLQNYKNELEYTRKIIERYKNKLIVFKKYNLQDIEGKTLEDYEKDIKDYEKEVLELQFKILKLEPLYKKALERYESIDKLLKEIHDYDLEWMAQIPRPFL